MIRTNLLLVIIVTFNFVVHCNSLHIKYPAEVSVLRARSFQNHTYDLNIKGKCKSWDLKLVRLKNIWLDAVVMENISQENDTSNFEIMNILKNQKVYHDPEIGSVLSINGQEVEGILDSDFSIISENKDHYIVKLEHNETDEINDIFTPNISTNYYRNYSMDNETFDGDEFTNIFGAEPRMFNYRKTPRWTYPYFAVDVYLDSELINMLGDSTSIVRYLNTFWNKVLVSLKKMDPTFQIDLFIYNLALYSSENIKKISLPFITDNARTLDIDDIMTDLSNWVSLKYDYTHYTDIVYVHTNKDLRKDRDPAVKGVAPELGEICNNLYYSAAIGEDIDAVYNGVGTAAHEVGHILGASHDGDSNYCNSENGFIMGYLEHARGEMSFSSCSISSIITTVKNNWKRCEERKRRFIEYIDNYNG